MSSTVDYSMPQSSMYVWALDGTDDLCQVHHVYAVSNVTQGNSFPLIVAIWEHWYECVVIVYFSVYNMFCVSDPNVICELILKHSVCCV